MKEEKTNFGFKKVPISEKRNLVKNVFSEVAPVYDLMNDLMSLGIHRLWKKEFVKLILESNHNHILDVGGGTGDIAFKLKEKNTKLKTYVFDINKQMILKGKERSLDLGYLNNITWILGNAENLPFKDNYFCAYTTAFCFRNLTNIAEALKEAYRVLKKGGKFYCLEFSKVENDTLAKLYKLWSFKVIPKIGQIMAKNKNAYQYLVESIDKFYAPLDYKLLIEQAGFTNVSYKSLSFGVSAIHTAVKL